jgi:hypothetical protein
MSKVNQVAKENKDHHDHFKVSDTNSAINNITMVQDWSPQGFSTEAYWRKRIAEEQKIDKIRELAQSLAKTDYRGNPPSEHYIAKKIFDILDGN